MQETLVKWAAALIGSAALLAGMFIWGHHVGYTGEKAVFDKYVSNQKTIADLQVSNNKLALSNQQEQFNQALSQIQQDHKDEVTKLGAARDAALADSDAYASRLREYIARAGQQSTGVPHPAASAAGATDAGSGGLYDGVSDLNWYLVQRFYLADQNASRLNMAIALLAEDRKICNGSLPGITPNVSVPTH